MFATRKAGTKAKVKKLGAKKKARELPSVWKLNKGESERKRNPADEKKNLGQNTRGRYVHGRWGSVLTSKEEKIKNGQGSRKNGGAG